MEEYERLASDVMRNYSHSFASDGDIDALLNCAAVGMDPPDSALARIAPDGQFVGRRAEEAGRVPTISPQAQATSGGAEGQARDQLQHAADQAASFESTRIHAHRRQNGFGKLSIIAALDCQYLSCLVSIYFYRTSPMPGKVWRDARSHLRSGFSLK